MKISVRCQKGEIVLDDGTDEGIIGRYEDQTNQIKDLIVVICSQLRELTNEEKIDCKIT